MDVKEFEEGLHCFYGDLTGDFRDSLGTSLEADTHFVMATAMS